MAKVKISFCDYKVRLMGHEIISISFNLGQVIESSTIKLELIWMSHVFSLFKPHH